MSRFIQIYLIDSFHTPEEVLIRTNYISCTDTKEEEKGLYVNENKRKETKLFCPDCQAALCASCYAPIILN